MYNSKLAEAFNKYEEGGINNLLSHSNEYLKSRITCYWRQLRYLIKWRGSRPTPAEIIWIDPDDIIYCAPTLTGPKYDLDRACCHVVGGEWDKNRDYDGRIYKRQFKNKPYLTEPQLISFNQYVFYNSLERHFSDGVPWTETEMYNWAKNNLGASSRYDCEKDVMFWLKNIDKLYKKINNNGYLSQQELINQNLLENSIPFPEYNEVNINITRNGEFVLGINGRHRASIAKILGIKKIPVRVFARHKKWQEVRYKYYSLPISKVPESIKSYRSHPDIQKLINS